MNIKRMINGWTIFAYVLILLGGVGAILLGIQQSISAYNDSIKNTESHEKTQNIVVDKSKETQNELKRRADIIDKKNKEIKKLQDKLIDKSEFIEKYISGGNSYPILHVVQLGNLQNLPNKINFDLINEFKLPNYDVRVELYDYDLIKLKTFRVFGHGERNFMKPTDYEACRLLFHKEALLKPEAILKKLYGTELREGNFFAKIFTRNKLIIQKISIYKDDNVFYIGSEFFDDDIQKTLLTKYSSKLTPKVKQILRKRLDEIPNNLELGFFE